MDFFDKGRTNGPLEFDGANISPYSFSFVTIQFIHKPIAHGFSPILVLKKFGPDLFAIARRLVFDHKPHRILYDTGGN